MEIVQKYQELLIQVRTRRPYVDFMHIWNMWSYGMFLFNIVFEVKSDILFNKDYSETSAVFFFENSSRLYSEKKVVKVASTLDICLHYCMEYFSCDGINCQNTGDNCEILENVTNAKHKDGWLAATVDVDTSIVSVIH